MSDSQELQVQRKREVEKKTEGTAPGRSFVPVTDIFETPEALTVVLEMPGVDRNSIEFTQRAGDLQAVIAFEHAAAVAAGAASVDELV